jgi:hypothetical protein
MKNIFISITIYLMLTFLVSISYAATIIVPDEQPTIQDGINAAGGSDEVLVRATGSPYTGANNKNLTFGGKAITVRSESGPFVTIIDCEGSGRGFVFNGAAESGKVDGFTIKNGKPGANGGAIACQNASPMIVNCIITGNAATGVGGGIIVAGGTPTIIGNLIFGNSTTTYGGGIGVAAGTVASAPTIINSTITQNSATSGGGGLGCPQGNATVLNTIIWGATGGDDIVIAAGRTVTISYSDYGTKGGAGTLTEGDGMLHNVDPLFVGGGDYHLTDVSPCIGAGTSAGLPAEAAKDIDGNDRPNPLGSPPDMGADENPNDRAGIITLEASGPSTWSYILTYVRGAISEWSYTGDGITNATVTGAAAGAGWQVASQTSTKVVFSTVNRLTSGSLTGFEIEGTQVGIGSWNCHAESGDVEGPLPVEVSIFIASADSMKVTLNWRAETETNNLGFNIYRSDAKDGKYIKINARLIAGAGSDATPHDYSFTDEDIVFGKTYYYYLEDIDFSGKTNKSHIIEVTVGKQTITRIIPIKSALFQNFPNPFNPETWIPFQLARGASVTVRIYNPKGQPIRTIELGQKAAGTYLTRDKAVYWDGRDDAGEKVASGVYFYTLKAGEFMATRRMVVIE